MTRKRSKLSRVHEATLLMTDGNQKTVIGNVNQVMREYTYTIPCFQRVLTYKRRRDLE